MGRGAPGNAIFDAHRDDPEFGYRFLLDEAGDAGHDMSERTAWRIYSDNGWWSRFGKKKRYANARVGAPAHDDLVRREFTAPAANMVWLSDLTEHPTPWIPAVVATPGGGVGDGRSEVHEGAEGNVLLADRPGWDGPRGGEGSRCSRGRSLRVVAAGWSVDAAGDAAQVHGAGQDRVLPTVGAEPERRRRRSRARLHSGHLLRLGL
jgi:hypothetical protein